MKPGWVRQLLAMIIGMCLGLPVHAQFGQGDPAARPTPTAFATRLEVGDLEQAQAWLDYLNIKLYGEKPADEGTNLTASTEITGLGIG